jgi:hypothetical protein
LKGIFAEEEAFFEHDGATTGATLVNEAQLLSTTRNKSAFLCAQSGKVIASTRKVRKSHHQSDAVQRKSRKVIGSHRQYKKSQEKSWIVIAGACLNPLKNAFFSKKRWHFFCTCPDNACFVRCPSCGILNNPARVRDNPVHSLHSLCTPSLS